MAERTPAKTEKIKKPVELQDKFLKVIKDWQKLEDDTIRYSEEMMKMTKNKLVRLTMEMIKHDSQKHSFSAQTTSMLSATG
jgi:hypothetical protein